MTLLQIEFTLQIVRLKIFISLYNYPYEMQMNKATNPHVLVQEISYLSTEHVPTSPMCIAKRYCISIVTVILYSIKQFFFT